MLNDSIAEIRTVCVCASKENVARASLTTTATRKKVTRNQHHKVMYK